MARVKTLENKAQKTTFEQKSPETQTSRPQEEEEEEEDAENIAPAAACAL